MFNHRRRVNGGQWLSSIRVLKISCGNSVTFLIDLTTTTVVTHEDNRTLFRSFTPRWCQSVSLFGNGSFQDSDIDWVAYDTRVAKTTS